MNIFSIFRHAWFHKTLHLLFSGVFQFDTHINDLSDNSTHGYILLWDLRHRIGHNFSIMIWFQSKNKQLPATKTLFWPFKCNFTTVVEFCVPQFSFFVVFTFAYVPFMTLLMCELVKIHICWSYHATDIVDAKQSSWYISRASSHQFTEGIPYRLVWYKATLVPEAGVQSMVK